MLECVEKKKKRRRIMYIGLLVVCLAVVATGVIFMNRPEFGRAPRGLRLERIRQSTHYKNGKFQNLEPTPQITSGNGRVRTLLDFLFEKKERNRPEFPLPVLRTDLTKLNQAEDLFVWFGHSSYLLQTGGRRVLVDPVFETASPVSFINRPFQGTDAYTPEEMPEIDYLIITHDHWDHLDYETVLKLKDRVQRVICPLGVGEYFEYWGFDPRRITELDWNESTVPEDGFIIHCLPARHFSGRSLVSNPTLWASFLIQTPLQKIYLAGDGGYGAHFAEIARRFPEIDLAVLENGQYNQNWKYIHLMPDDLSRVINDLHPRKVLTVHHAKYALAPHPWDEPLNNAYKIAAAGHVNLMMPRIGEILPLAAGSFKLDKWWSIR